MAQPLQSKYGFKQTAYGPTTVDRVALPVISLLSQGEVILKAFDQSAADPAIPGQLQIGGGDVTASTAVGAYINPTNSLTANVDRGGSAECGPGVFGTNVSAARLRLRGGTVTTGGSSLSFAGQSLAGPSGDWNVVAGTNIGTDCTAAGNVYITGGVATGALGAGGYVYVNGGQGSTVNDNGDIIITAAQSTGGGSDGELHLVVGGVTYIWPTSSTPPANGAILTVASSVGNVVTLSWV